MKGKDKKYEQIEHLSDIGLKIYGNSLEELFENAAEGMFSIMCDINKVGIVEEKGITIDEDGSISFEELLIIWLENLLYEFEVYNMLFSKFKISKFRINGNRSIIKAKIFGEKIDFGRHEIIVAIKAPTYHMLEVKRDNKTNSWMARVIFDV